MLTDASTPIEQGYSASCVNHLIVFSCKNQRRVNFLVLALLLWLLELVRGRCDFLRLSGLGQSSLEWKREAVSVRELAFFPEVLLLFLGEGLFFSLVLRLRSSLPWCFLLLESSWRRRLSLRSYMSLTRSTTSCRLSSACLLAQQESSVQFLLRRVCWRSRQYVAVRCVCLLLATCASRPQVANPNSPICCSISRQYGTIDSPGMIPLTRAPPENPQKLCARISSTVARFKGSVCSMRERRSVSSSLACEGISQFPSRMARQSWAESGLSKGRYPKHMAQSMMPALQRSTLAGSQGNPASISGAAQQGDPQAVASVSPRVKMLLSPKSTSFTLYLQSKRIFSGFKSRCTTPISCRYSIAATNCVRKRAASNSESLSLSTI